jgi:excinuclease UvrABC nuclease subunit
MKNLPVLLDELDVENSARLETTLSLLPDSAGVYIMKDKDDKIIYIGKAKNISVRVKSYFSNHQSQQSLKTSQLMNRIS